jgi:hypothetical protein
MKRNALFLVATIFIAAPLPSSAQIKLELNQLICGEWLGYSPENQDFVRFWLSGYYNASGGKNVLDYKRLQRNSVNITEYCKTHKADTLPTAIQKIAY